ncbi:MAG: chemotaxis protein CheW, partial [Planctomycetota bacterium]|nr:chemotaxis protein CheW [Planctomycetota bacterium]
MVTDSTLKKLRKLTSDLVMVDSSSPSEDWSGISETADSLIGDFLQAGESEAQELVQLLRDIALSLAKGIIANPGEGVKAIQSVIGVLQGMESPAGIPESLRKQALAEGKLFFSDVKKEESWVKEESAFQDDEEEREMTMAIESRIDELENDLITLNPPVSDTEQVRAIFRQFHTLKGEGAICGRKSVSEFCHGIETEIEDARSGNLILTAEIIAALQELSAIIRPILAGKSREEIGESLIQSLMDELRATVAEAKKMRESGMLPSTEDGAPASSEGTEDQFADFFSGFVPPPEKTEPKNIESWMRDETGSDPLPPTADSTAAVQDDETITLTESPDAEEFLSSLNEAVKPFSPETEAIPALSSMPPAVLVKTDGNGVPAVSEGSKAKPGRKPELSPSDTVIESGDLLGLSGGTDTASLKKDVIEKKVDENKVKAISVDVTRLDDLLEIAGEVALIGTYLTTKLAGQEGLALQSTNLSRTCGRLQEVANSLRMTSVRPLFMTVRRAAADAARVSRKMIDINMRGIDTLVDRSIVENLSAALIHIIRNAVDHGIEPVEERLQAGKPERGSITISASRTNSDIAIELGDDGMGFNLQAIHDKAVSMGKIAPDAKLTEEELADLVFLPGLSTAKKLTGLSGRGVGMEIVRTSIDDLRGKVEIKTARGKGSTVRLRFPLMVAAVDSMLVRVGKNVLAIPVSQVRECFRPATADIGTIENQGTIVTIRGIILPILFLGREFGIKADADLPKDGVLIVVETGEMLAAVLVDEMLGTSQVVVRNLEGPIAGSDLVAGAAVLPDGSIGLVIETAALTARVATSASKAFSDAGNRQAENSRQIDTVSIGSNQVGMIDFSIIAPDRHDGRRTHTFAINAFKTREFVPVAPLRSIP